MPALEGEERQERRVLQPRWWRVLQLRSEELLPRVASSPQRGLLPGLFSLAEPSLLPQLSSVQRPFLLLQPFSLLQPSSLLQPFSLLQPSSLQELLFAPPQDPEAAPVESTLLGPLFGGRGRLERPGHLTSDF